MSMFLKGISNFEFDHRTVFLLSPSDMISVTMCSHVAALSSSAATESCLRERGTSVTHFQPRLLHTEISPDCASCGDIMCNR